MATDRKILLSLCGSLTLCDHMGDVSNDVYEALKQAGITIENDDSESWGNPIARSLHRLGVKTLYGTELVSD